jgi:hypothetical protein
VISKIEKKKKKDSYKLKMKVNYSGAGVFTLRIESENYSDAGFFSFVMNLKLFNYNESENCEIVQFLFCDEFDDE